MVGDEMGLPPTTFLPRGSVVADPYRAAARALSIVGAQRVCAKLGFSYEALSVVDCTGAQELGNALQNLLNHWAMHDGVYVQVRVPDVAFEARVFMVNGKLTYTSYTRFTTVSDLGHFQNLEDLTRDECIEKRLMGDAAAMESAEQQIAVLRDRWMKLLTRIGGDQILSTRLDYLVAYAEGTAKVWTCEVGEQGYSMMHWADGVNTVFRNVAYAALEPPCGDVCACRNI